MVQALKTGELDYAHGANADQLNQLKTEPNIATVAGKANGWTPARLQRLRRRHRQDDPERRPSTKALLDPAFRDALGYAIDKRPLVERVLGGYGDVGTTIVPPVLDKWHVEPTTPRTFDIEKAKQLLDAAGYTLDASGKRLDKEGKPITLRISCPNSDDELPEGRAVHQGLVRPARDRRHAAGPRLGGRSARRSCRPRPATATRPTTTSSCGAGAAASTRTGCCRSSSAARSAPRPTASTATRAYDQMYEHQLKAPTGRRAQGDPRRRCRT